MNVVEYADDWLQENGYSLMHKSSDNTLANYAALDGCSSVEVFIKNGEVRFVGCGFIPQSMIQIKTSDFGINNKALFFNLNKIEKAVWLYQNHLDGII